MNQDFLTMSAPQSQLKPVFRAASNCQTICKQPSSSFQNLHDKAAAFDNSQHSYYNLEAKNENGCSGLMLNLEKDFRCSGCFSVDSYKSQAVEESNLAKIDSASTVSIYLLL